MEQDKMEARKKGFIAFSAWGGSLLLATSVSPVLGVLGGAGAAYLTYQWFMFRAKRGMRF